MSLLTRALKKNELVRFWNRVKEFGEFFIEGIFVITEICHIRSMSPEDNGMASVV